MLDLSLIASVFASSVLGCVLGLVTGLVPGLHMNNIAAAVVAFGSVLLGLFGSLTAAAEAGLAGACVSCFISAALVGHLFSESIVSTYVGIPDEDVVSVLPAHRLAKAGLGELAVRSSVEGALSGTVWGVLCIFPVCALMGTPGLAYDLIRMLMPFVISAFIALLILSEGYPTLRPGRHVPGHVLKMVSAFALFPATGVLGTCVLLTDYYASPVSDFPWMQAGFVARSSLLLPLFAGSFGVPSLLLSIDSRPPLASARPLCLEGLLRPTTKETLVCIFGGVMVGWLPGMTSGSAATVCSPTTSDGRNVEDVFSAVRFIRSYSAISASGAVMSVGALFVIQRARSGSMDAVSWFLGGDAGHGPWFQSVPTMSAMLLAMIVSALMSYWMILWFQTALSRSGRVLCSKHLAVASLIFVASLCAALTGVRGLLVMAAATSLGLIPPLFGIRRLQLMGSLLVPVWILFVTQA